MKHINNKMEYELFNSLKNQMPDELINIVEEYSDINYAEEILDGNYTFIKFYENESLVPVFDTACCEKKYHVITALITSDYLKKENGLSAESAFLLGKCGHPDYIQILIENCLYGGNEETMLYFVRGCRAGNYKNHIDSLFKYHLLAHHAHYAINHMN